MFLGLVLHATVAYKVVEHSPIIPRDTQFTHWLFDFGYFIIHSFRMPLFFLVAGFFCRMLYYKIGEKAFIKHRWKRIVVPFLVSVVIIVPVSLLPSHMYQAVYKMNMSWDQAWASSIKRMLKYNGIYHIWFLYDLIMFYVVVVVLMRLKKSRRLVAKGLSGLVGWWNKVDFNKSYWFVLFSLPIWLILFVEKDLFVFVDINIVPKHPAYIVFYGYIFMLGWLFHIRQDVLNSLDSKRWIFTVIGALLCIMLFYAEWNGLFKSVAVFRTAKLFTAIQLLLLSFGIMGMFLHNFKKESNFWRYASDSAYWVYLTHIGIVVGLQFILMNSWVPGILRFPIVLIVPTIITLVSYHWLVRYTIIGEYLHGKRIK